MISRKKEDVEHADLIRKAWNKISLAEYRIKVVSTRFTRKGDTILELRSGGEGRPGDFGFANLSGTQPSLYLALTFWLLKRRYKWLYAMTPAS